jgi:hypothetical protein
MAVWRDRRRANLGDLALMSRRLPPPWSVDEENAACFIVKDHERKSLAYVYFEDEPGRRSAPKLLTRDEARDTCFIEKPPRFGASNGTWSTWLPQIG